MLHQQTNFLKLCHLKLCTSQTCDSRHLATVLSSTRHGYEMKSINFIEQKLDKNKVQTQTSLCPKAYCGKCQTREDNPITIDSKMCFSGSERTITILTRWKAPPPKKKQKNKPSIYTPVFSNSNGKHPIFNWEHETIIQT